MKAGDIDNYADILESAELNAKNDWEMDFVFDLMNKFDEYGDDTFVSEAQLEKLEKIAGRL